MRLFLPLIVLFFLLLEQPLQAEGRYFNDDFSGDLGKWELVNGAWSYWQIRDQALYATLTQSRKLSTIVPKDEFWLDMKEYEVDFIFKVFDKSDKNFVLGMRDASHFYDFHFYNNQLIVEDIRNGFSLVRTSIPFVLETNHDYAIHLLYSKEKIEMLVDGEKLFATDATWPTIPDGGKFGLKIATGSVANSKAYFDEIVVREFLPNNVYFKQNDELWASSVYDHADLWSSDPSMSRWACALSSVAMLLRSHGFHFLENGEILNPVTLNQWLLTQADGYVAGGLVNWLAISRLSQLLSNQVENSLPKLEFSYFQAQANENLETLREFLADDSTQIAAVPGHFFLVEDYLEDEDDFKIKDPLYDYELLSLVQKPVESLRLFKPSFTDLSYLFLVVPNELDFSLSDELGYEIESLQEVKESIVFGEETIGADYKLFYYAKPEEQRFNLLFTSKDFSWSDLDKVQIFLYQLDGSLQSIDLFSLLPEQQNFGELKQLLLKIDFAKTSTSEYFLELIEKSIDEQKQAELSGLAKQVNDNFQAGKLSFYLFYQFNLLLDSLRSNLDYFFLLAKFLDFHGLQYSYEFLAKD